MLERYDNTCTQKPFLDTLVPRGMSDASLFLFLPPTSGTRTVGSMSIPKAIQKLSSVLTVGRFEAADGIGAM
jgi:hypothetical protein